MNNPSCTFTFDGPNAVVKQNQFEAAYSNLVEEYRKTKKSVEVDFRKLVPLHSGADRSTHLMHSYPAKLLPNIPIFFLNSGLLGNSASVVYDPFCGTGTVLLEAILAGHEAIGADANPIARKITRVKTTSHCGEKLRNTLTDVLVRAEHIDPTQFSPVVDVNRWFTEKAKEELGKLLAAINTVEDSASREFFEVSFSQCVRKCSLADPRMAVPVKKKGARCIEVDAAELLQKTALNNIQRLERLPDNSLPTHIGSDARHSLPGKRADVDMIITSPPYAGAQKYIRASSLSLGWLGLAPENRLRKLEMLNIGREHLTANERQISWNDEPNDLRLELDRVKAINPTRASIFANYITDMRLALKTSLTTLRDGGHLVLVVGDNMVCGQPIQTSRYVKSIVEQENFEVALEVVDAIKSRGLMTKRNKTAGIISHEHVIVFRKINGKAGNS